VKKDDISVELPGNELVVTGDLKDGADGHRNAISGAAGTSSSACSCPPRPRRTR
jgi:hypothetical protein